MPNIIRTGGGTVAIPPTYIYDLGDECTTLTGGIVAITSFSSYTVQAITKNVDNVYLPSSGFNHISGFSTNTAIDFTNYTKLKMEVSQFTANTECYLTLRVYDTKTYTTLKGHTTVTAPFSTTTVIEVDVGNMNFSAYPMVMLFTGQSGSVSNANIKKVWLE